MMEVIIMAKRKAMSAEEKRRKELIAELLKLSPIEINDDINGIVGE